MLDVQVEYFPVTAQPEMIYSFYTFFRSLPAIRIFYLERMAHRTFFYPFTMNCNSLINPRPIRSENKTWVSYAHVSSCPIQITYILFIYIFVLRASPRVGVKLCHVVYL